MSTEDQSQDRADNLDLDDSVKLRLIRGPETYERLTQGLGFRQVILEKVIRLGEVLTAISAEATIQDVLALKGGTALNLLSEPIRRLSVDIDLNYIGAVERDAMLRARPGVLEALADLAADLGYEPSQPRDDHGGTKLSFRYRNSLGQHDDIDVDVNWLARVPLLPPSRVQLWQPPGVDRTEVLVLAREELAVGKMLALIDRVAARDVFDTCYLPELFDAPWPPAHLRPFYVLHSGTLPKPLHSYKVDRIDRLSESEYKKKLDPVLHESDTTTRAQIIQTAKSILAPMLELAENELLFIDELQIGNYRPELLFPENQELVARVSRHPALLWKATNAKAHAAGS